MGTEGSSSEYNADIPGPDYDDRQRGKVDVWTFTDNNNIGKFKCLSIRMKGEDGWIFKEVLMMRL